MINLLALSPVLILLIGALAMLPAPFFPRLRPFIPVVAILAALILLVLNTRQPDTTPFLLPRAAADADLDFMFQFNPVSLFFSGLVLVTFLARVLVENLRPATRMGAGSLVVLAGAVTFFCANNWTMFAVGWLLADLGLFAWRLTFLHRSSARVFAWRAFGASQLGLFLFIVAGVLLVANGSPLRLAETTLEGFTATLMILAAWIRSGLYPFHYTLPADPASPPGDNLRGFAVTSLLGLYLLAVALSRLEGVPAYAEVLQLLALLGVGATTLLVLMESAPTSNLAWAARAIGAPVFLSSMVAGSVQVSFVVWLALGLFNFVTLVLGASFLRAQTRRRPWGQLVWGVAILCAAGFPFTPAFLGRVGIYAAALQSGDVLTLALVSAATALALVPLWRAFFAAGQVEERKPTVPEYLGLALLLIPTFVEGLFSVNLIGFWGHDVQEASAFATDALVHAPNILQPVLLLAAIILPPILAFYLSRAMEPFRARLGPFPRALAAVLDLSAFMRPVIQLAESLGALSRRVNSLIELYPVGWVLFVAIWVALWLLNVR